MTEQELLDIGLNECRKSLETLPEICPQQIKYEFCFKCGFGYAMGILKECVNNELNKTK